MNRRVATANTIKGSSTFHSVDDIGREGFVVVRPMSCHQCEGCWEGPVNIASSEINAHVAVQG